MRWLLALLILQLLVFSFCLAHFDLNVINHDY